MKQLWFIVLAMVVSYSLSAQGYYWQSGTKESVIKNLTVDGGAGGRMYFGDIQKDGAVYNPVKLAYGVGVRYQMRPRLGFVIEGEGRKYRGKAEHGGFPDAIDEMEGSLWGGHLAVQYSWLKWEDFTQRQFTDRDPVTKINLFVGAGFGGAMFNSSYTSRTYKRRTVTDSLGRDSSFNVAVDASGSAGGFGMYVPVQFGVRYRFSPQLHLGAEITRQIYITNNVDAFPSKKLDGMLTFMARVGYTFGQKKRKGETKKISKKGKFR
ncbi:MAG: hypothetical protein Salg2KO_13600 [Salibacteraceae bacterium]